MPELYQPGNHKLPRSQKASMGPSSKPVEGQVLEIWCGAQLETSRGPGCLETGKVPWSQEASKGPGRQEASVWYQGTRKPVWGQGAGKPVEGARALENWQGAMEPGV